MEVEFRFTQRLEKSQAQLSSCRDLTPQILRPLLFFCLTLGVHSTDEDKKLEKGEEQE